MQPVVIEYEWKTVDPCKVYGGGPGIGKLIGRLLTSWHNGVRVTFLPVRTPDDEERADPLYFAENVRKSMADAMGVPTTNHTYGDVRLLLEARKTKHINAKDLREFNLEMSQLLRYALTHISPPHTHTHAHTRTDALPHLHTPPHTS